MSDALIKQGLHMLPYGFYSITSRADDEVNAMVANWVTQVSYEPRQMAIVIQKTSFTRGLNEKGGVFAVNIFHQEDAGAIKAFTKGRAKNPEK